MFNYKLVEKILVDPIRHGADKLAIVSGYATGTMASWHIKYLQEEKFDPIDISLIVGMCPDDGISIRAHEDFKELHSVQINGYSRFYCMYVCQGAAVHSKVYIWLKDGKPFRAFTGSINYTQSAFGTGRREYAVECDPEEAYQYYTQIEKDTIFCTHSEIEEAVAVKKDSYTDLNQKDGSSDTDIITLSLLQYSGKGDVGFGSGINWGHRKNGTKREPNQAYISLPAKYARSGFFPLGGQHFSVITDDKKQLILRVEQEHDKAITTPMNNSQLGEYLRYRIGVPNGEFVTKEALERYGRTDITFQKIDEEQFYMDFSV